MDEIYAVRADSDARSRQRTWRPRAAAGGDGSLRHDFSVREREEKRNWNPRGIGRAAIALAASVPAPDRDYFRLGRADWAPARYRSLAQEQTQQVRWQR